MGQKKYISLVLILLFSGSFEVLLGESLVFPPYLHSYGIRKATPKHLFMFFGPRTHFDNPQGLATARLKSWDDPKTKKDDDEVVVYGVNSGQCEIIFNTSMYGLSIYGKKGSGKDQFLYPKGIAANSHGKVFVADSGNSRVVSLFNPKTQLKWKTSFPNEKSGSLKLKGPSRVAIDEDCLVYVTDFGNNRIVVFDTNGVVQRIIPEKGSFSFEKGVTAIAFGDGRERWSFFDDEEVLFCADQDGTRIWKLTKDGKVLKTISMPKGYTASYGAIDFYHNYWVTDQKNHCILKFDHNLKLLDIFGSHGSGDNQFEEPRGLAIYKRFGQVFVAEKKGAQYFWVGTHLKDAGIKKLQNASPLLKITTTEYSLLTIFQVAQKDTTLLLNKWMIYPGGVDVSFPETTKNLSNNVFIKIEPTYSSKTYNSWIYPVSVMK